ncbi:hypothetical protein ALQ33_200079 [Pseudomonas syringae pv. philadelphi]|uniref:Uncharacterized protein n=1 Tax=Pseudomonas syringae pv. philadelphi TaxID=251706 RepID=A0A3M3Z8G8_9PSED|nr:hypothetical protein ALQ33_200079 [Pseudomonas syringae pv. philadelphi]
MQRIQKIYFWKVVWGASPLLSGASRDSTWPRQFVRVGGSVGLWTRIILVAEAIREYQGFVFGWSWPGVGQAGLYQLVDCLKNK